MNRLLIVLIIAATIKIPAGGVHGQEKSVISPIPVPLPVPERTESEKMVMAGVGLIKHKAGQMKAFAYTSSSSKIAKKLGFDIEQQSNIKILCQNLAMELQSIALQAEIELPKMENVERSNVESYLARLGTASKQFSKQLEAVVGSTSFLALKSEMLAADLSRRGLAMILLQELSGTLKLSETQKKSIMSIESTAREEINEALSEIRSKRNKQVFDSLSDEQRESLKSHFQGAWKWD